MCYIQKAGGPDDEGYYSSDTDHLVLGHRRLSIIDLSQAGHQPMPYAAERYWITYNGELYNYKELKAELTTAGCLFNTSCDTEVILAAFSYWGDEAFKRFNGMFAFALFDTHTKDIFLVRDGSGIKPLYFAITKEGLAFSSEVKAFAPIPYLQEEHPHWPVYLAAYGHLPEPVTTLKQVQPLQKNTYLQYNTHTGAIHATSYSRYSYLEKIKDRSEAICLIKDTLLGAVRRHLVADAPIGVFLSGGLDSSIIALLANNHHNQLNTLSIYFNDDKYSEKKYQDILKERLVCNHRQHLLQEEEFHRFLPAIIDAMDLPGSDGINNWFISKYAKESGLKAVLSGIGGDELCGGYPSFRRMKMALLFERFPSAILRAGRLGASKKIRRLAYLSLGGPVGKFLFLRGQFTPHEIAVNTGASEKEIWQILGEQPRLPDIDHLTPGNQASWIEMNMYMQNQLLRDADVMSMAHGVEIRVPFLDAEFVKLALEIHSSEKYRGPASKQILIDSFKDILPGAIWNRPKMGFSFPFRDWFASDAYAREITAGDKHGYYKKFISGDMHWSQFLTSLLITKHNHAG